MTEFIRQLAFINAILGGFTITFLSVMLTAAVAHRIVNWIAGVTMTSAACFVLSALGATFGAVIANNNEQLPPEVDARHEPLSLLFLGGTLMLFVALGMSRWMRFRRLGVATTVNAAIAVISGYFILEPFIY